MEIICARVPVDHNRPQVQISYLQDASFTLLSVYKKNVSLIIEISHSLQVYLVDWLTSMIVNKQIALVVDPKLPDMLPSKELQRMLLLALRCVLIVI